MNKLSVILTDKYIIRITSFCEQSMFSLYPIKTHFSKIGDNIIILTIRGCYNITPGGVQYPIAHGHPRMQARI